MTAYFISGLGADKKIFDRLRLPDNYDIVHIPWLEPEKGEPLSHYCERMGRQINQKDDFVLVGMSFGALVAIELSKTLHPKQVIIISSVASHHEFPFKFRLARALRLQKLVPVWLIKIPNPLLYWIFSAHTEKEKSMLRYFLRTVSPRYLKWSMSAVLNWKNEWRPKNLFHIHGTADRIFPIDQTHADAKIFGGGHFMAYDRADEISEILDLQLRS